MSPCLASASSKSKYDVFFDLRDATCFERAFIENKLRDAGITSSLEDVEEVLYAYEAAERSGIVMVLFTWDFLASQMCLKRLVARLEQWNNNLVLLPVFRGVSPQVVEKMLPDLLPASDFARVSFLPGFKLSLDFRKKISSCVAALGWFMFNDESFHYLPLHHQVGLKLSVSKLLKSLGWRYILSDDTIRVRIWGEGGIGKTTIVKTIYDRIGEQFEGKSFLSNIKNVWEEDNGEVLLKKQVISDISETELDETNTVVMHEQMKQMLDMISFDDDKY